MFGVTTCLPPVYIPAELAVLRFSLTAGVEEVVQAFLQPGPVPRGYTRECIDNSRRLHQIPLTIYIIVQSISDNNLSVL